ncbi:spore coat U domain-containing protein [Rhodoferax sp.]|uniref:Csu type fimbrial protein n=1 Tax=Rhodoferax sp. TaxID=50421 RepID=UPI00260A3078|nr:spore coat U domain-containing protein [Rhodoferax sp.]MDD5480934.1 spore coat U domain-containing protein [Rhodoferax sp.]
MKHIKLCTNTSPGILRVIFRMGAVVSALALAQAGYAATATGLMTVTATVAASCVVGTSTLAFASATSAAIAAGNVDATGTIAVNCTSGSGYTVSLGAGTGTGATTASRKMTAGTQLLSYTVYTTEARTTVWGDNTTGSGSVAGIGTGASQSITAYGRIFAGQVVSAATYADTLNVTVTY